VVAFAEVELAGGVSCDDAGDALVVDGDGDLGEEAFDADADDVAGELVASADAAEALTGFGGGLKAVFGEEGLERGVRDAVVSAGGGPGGELAGENPLLDGGVADAEHARGFARGEEGLGRHAVIVHVRDGKGGRKMGASRATWGIAYRAQQDRRELRPAISTSGTSGRGTWQISGLG
jgi:hypothetical protein